MSKPSNKLHRKKNLSRSRTQVDLFLGSDIGLWVLNKVDPKDINHIFSMDLNIRRKAGSMGIPSHRMHPHQLKYSNAAVGVSIHYPLVLKRRFINRYRKVYNLHPGFLPWGRGYYPAFWALWAGEPAGVTLHEMVAELDAGPIIHQQRVAYVQTDTIYALHKCLRAIERKIFTKYWPKILSGKKIQSKKNRTKGSYHSKLDYFNCLQNIKWNRLSTRDFIRLILCTSFPGYPGLRIGIDNRSVEIRAVI